MDRTLREFGRESLRLSGRLFGNGDANCRDCLRRDLDLATYLSSRFAQGMGAGKKPFTSQVGGHAGVSTSEDGSLLFKPALPREVAFYEHLTSNPRFAPLRRYIPKFYGTLRLEGKVEDGNLETLREAPAPEEGKDKYFNSECR